MSRKLKRIRLTSTNGDVHFIYEDDLRLSKWVIEKEGFDEFEARKVSKGEASKPLFLVRGD
jgi:hypothetical protein